MKKSDQILQADDARADVTMHAAIPRHFSGDITFRSWPQQDGAELEQRLFTITMLLVGCAGLASFVENILLGSISAPNCDDSNSDSVCHSVAICQKRETILDSDLPLGGGLRCPPFGCVVYNAEARRR